MKILFISHFKEATGVGQAARDYIMAMDSVGLDVVPKAIRLGAPLADIPERILELEKKSSVDSDVCIQFLLPHQMRYDGSFKKCIALFDYECFSFESSGWPYLLDQFDEVWVPNGDALLQGQQSGISAKMRVIPHAINLNRFTTIQGQFKKIVDGGFVFYFIGEATQRKNIGALVKAFHTEFGIDEDVNLLMKTSKHGLSSDECRGHVQGYIENIKKGLKLYPSLDNYKKETIITERLSEKQMLDLHYSCGCFCMPSRGEAFCLPLADALAMGRPALVTNVGGMRDMVSTFNGFAIPYTKAPCEGLMDSFPFLYTGHELWAEIDIEILRQKMRFIFEHRNHSYYQQLCENAKVSIDQLSYSNIGNKIKEALCSQ